MGRAAAIAALLAASLGCAGGPWDVAEGDELRFRRNARECRMLTQDAEGADGPIGFDQCMHNRGWKRMGPWKRMWRRL